MNHQQQFAPKQFFLILGLSVTMPLSLCFSGLTGEPLYLITHNTLQTLAIGTIIATNQTSTRFQPYLTLSGKQLHSVITTSHGSTESLFSIGDRAIVSIQPEGWNYRLDQGAFQVSSLNPRTLKIIKGSLSGGNLLAFQWYVNTCGEEKEFSYGGSRYFVRQLDGTLIPIAKNIKKGWVPLRKASPSEIACSKLYLARQSSQSYSMVPWLLGTVISLGLIYWVSRIFKLRFVKP